MRPREAGNPGRRALRKMRQPKMLSHSAGELGSAAPPPGWVELRARARIRSEERGYAQGGREHRQNLG